MKQLNQLTIVGIDQGYGNMKTANTLFPTAITAFDTAPVFQGDVLEYDGRFYRVGEGHKGFVADKSSDEDFYLLTLAAVAKELELYRLFTANLCLAVGLPLSWVGSQRESFRQYLLQKQAVTFRLNGHLFQLRITGCKVYPQGYAARVRGLQVQGRLNPETREKAMALLETYGLADFAKSYPGQLSGGMRQKVALIRTLACSPDLLLLDEPFSALDYQTRLTLGDEIHGILRREGKTAVLVTHDIAEAISMSDRVLVFSSRPARLKATHSIVLSGPDSPIQRRNAPEFKDYFDAIWKELDRHDQ